MDEGAILPLLFTLVLQHMGIWRDLLRTRTSNAPNDYRAHMVASINSGQEFRPTGKCLGLVFFLEITLELKKKTKKKTRHS